MFYALRGGKFVMGENDRQVAAAARCEVHKLSEENMSAIMLARKLHVTDFVLVQNGGEFQVTVQEDPDECPGFCDGRPQQ